MRSTPTAMTAHDPASRSWTPWDARPLPERDPDMDDAEWEAIKEAHTREVARDQAFYSRERVSTGLDLLPYFVDWLDHRMGRQSVADRLEELKERYPEAAQAHLLKKRGKTQAQIAVEMGVSQATVSRLLQRAVFHIAHGSTHIPEALSAEDRFALLYDQHPIPCEVYVYASYGWRYSRIAEAFNLSERTVKRYVAAIRTHLGDPVDRKRLARFIKAA